MTDFVLDTARPARIGFGEAIFCAGKSAAQIDAIVQSRQDALLLTRLGPEKFHRLASRYRLDYHEQSGTAFSGEPAPLILPPVAIVTAGTSDLPVAWEAARTLRFEGADSTMIADVGVAGLWRLLGRLDELSRHAVIIVVAGMDAALPTVLGGLVPGAIIAVPTSVGYGVATGGRVALDAMLASCAPGVAVVNIDNGYGAACAALRVVRVLAAAHAHQEG
jgi:NCAIR mutase (PurE)-related protein